MCGQVAAWFCYHAAFGVMIGLLPPQPVIDYGTSRRKLVEQCVWFSLRGLGIKEEAIRRYYNPQALALIER